MTVKTVIEGIWGAFIFTCFMVTMATVLLFVAAYFDKL